jgi:hypothetical protein
MGERSTTKKPKYYGAIYRLLSIEKWAKLFNKVISVCSSLLQMIDDYIYRYHIRKKRVIWRDSNAEKKKHICPFLMQSFIFICLPTVSTKIRCNNHDHRDETISWTLILSHLHTLPSFFHCDCDFTFVHSFKTNSKHQPFYLWKWSNINYKRFP